MYIVVYICSGCKLLAIYLNMVKIILYDWLYYFLVKSLEQVLLHHVWIHQRGPAVLAELTPHAKTALHKRLNANL